MVTAEPYCDGGLARAHGNELTAAALAGESSKFFPLWFRYGFLVVPPVRPCRRPMGAAKHHSFSNPRNDPVL